MSISFGLNINTQFQASFFNQLSPLSLGQSTAAKALLTQLDGFGFGDLGGQMPSLQQMMLPPPMGYMAGGLQQAMAHAAGFLQGLQASSMMDVSIGSRMLMSLGMFQSGALGGMGMMGMGGMGMMGGVGMMNMSISGFSSRRTDIQEKDKFAVHESCRTGADNPSNLNNSPHVKLALYNILKDNHDNMPPEQLQKELKDKYGIESELTTVKGNDGRDLKTLKFQNGDQLVDGSGNGSFGMADYNLKGAVKDIQEQYGITPEDFEKNAKAMKDAGLPIGQVMGGGQYGGGGQVGGFDYFQAQFSAVMPFGMQQSFFPMQDISRLFSQAWMFAQ